MSIKNYNWDKFFETLDELSTEIRKNHTEKEINEVYEILVEKNKVAEVEFIERLNKRKKEKLDKDE